MKLNKRITFRLPVTQIIDGLEQQVFIDGASVWASVQPLRGREFWQAQQVQSEGLIKITIRYLPNIKNDWKIRFEGVDYEITAPPIDIDMKHRFMEIYCKVVS